MDGFRVMRIGVPREVKDQEFRVGLTPDAVQALVSRGHHVLVENGAGIGAGFADADYKQVGAHLASGPAQIYEQQLVVKVKEPQASEYGLLHPDLLLFAYLHLAADQTLTEALLKSGATCIAYETVQTNGGQLPLLVPMSVIAGRLSVQFGAHYLTRQQGGRGVLLGGVPGVRPGRVVVLGGGIVGTEAARIAVGLGARVQIFDVNLNRLAELETVFGSRVELLYSTSANLEATVPEADLLIGAVLLPGRRAPLLVSRELVGRMQPGGVIVDVAVDQGGCIETVRPTSHTQPIYEEAGILHYGVPNIPGAVPWTATQALVNATLPYVLALAEFGEAALERDPALKRGLNLKGGIIAHAAVAEAFPKLSA